VFLRRNLHISREMIKECPGVLFDVVCPMVLRAANDAAQDPFEAPAANDLHDFMHLHPFSTPEAASQTQVAVGERSTSTHHDVSLAPTSLHRIPHYRAGHGRKEQRTAKQLTTMSYQLRQSLRGSPEHDARKSCLRRRWCFQCT
jgi:hypothetical protein